MHFMYFSQRIRARLIVNKALNKCCIIITIPSIHTSNKGAKACIQSYLNKVHLKLNHLNHMHIVHTRPCGIQLQSGTTEKQNTLPMSTHPILTYKAIIQNTAPNVHKLLHLFTQNLYSALFTKKCALMCYSIMDVDKV